MTTLKHSFQDRVVRERNELNIKVERLRPFIGGTVCASLPMDEQARLNDQLYHMEQYLSILDLRISNFSDD